MVPWVLAKHKQQQGLVALAVMQREGPRCAVVVLYFVNEC